MSLQFIEGFDALADYGERLGGYYGANISLENTIRPLTGSVA